jgi:hypothetical protein
MNGRLSYKRLYENSLKTIDMLKGQISTLKNKSNRIVCDYKEETPYNTFVNMINLQVEKENKQDIWEDSYFRDNFIATGFIAFIGYLSPAVMIICCSPQLIDKYILKPRANP